MLDEVSMVPMLMKSLITATGRTRRLAVQGCHVAREGEKVCWGLCSESAVQVFPGLKVYVMG